ncbi:MAG: hypothetical protein E7018_02735 [Alphaproteobacteria bacterium]|nr:hypothetical protein [Alphaproteobacteria bacterium]
MIEKYYRKIKKKITMLKNPDNRLYAIIDATDLDAIETVKSALKPFEPKYRVGKTVVVGGFNDVMFVEIRKREGPIFEILKNLAETHHFYPFYVVEEGKNLLPKADKYGAGFHYHVVEAAMADISVCRNGFFPWLQEFRAVAKAIYLDDSIFLKLHAYVREEDDRVHVLMANTENTRRHLPEDKVTLGEKGWHDAVLKLARLMSIEVEFKDILYKYL